MKNSECPKNARGEEAEEKKRPKSSAAKHEKDRSGTYKNSECPENARGEEAEEKKRPKSSAAKHEKDRSGTYNRRLP